MNRIFLLSFILLLVISCGESDGGERTDGYSQNSASPEDSLFQVVMDGHDEAMAKMGRLAGYRKQVDQKLDSLGGVRSTKKAELIKDYENLRDKLKTAEDGMNNWMHEFSIDSGQGNPELRMKYLSGEQAKVEKVRDDILGVLKEADSLLMKNNR